MLKEFKNFIMTGNVVEFAVAVIMAGAIGAVVNGFVADIIMPIVGHFSGGMDFSSISITLDEASKKADGTDVPANVIAIGKWINAIISLIVVGLVMFMIIKAYGKMKKPEPVAAPAGPTQEELLTQIRDLLKK
jgi:large conductance mechanosensitive channel